MAHIKVERRSMRPEEWTDLPARWQKWNSSSIPVSHGP